MKNILITGTSTGLGYYLTEQLLKHRYRVVALTRNPGAMNTLRKAWPDTLLCFKSHITNPTSLKKIFKLLSGRGISIDVLINNAGYGQIGPVESVSTAEAKKQFDVNFFSLLETSRLVIPMMRKKGSGKIIHVGSTSGLISSPFNGIYSASKHALEAVADAQRFELRSSGIKVVLLEPGKLATDYNNKILSIGNRLMKTLPAPYKAKFRTFLAREKANPGMKLDKISNKILKIIKMKNPSSRYMFDMYSRIITAIRRFTPEWFYNILIIKRNSL